MAKKKPGRPKMKVGRKSDFIRFRVSEAFKDWVIRFAESERSDLSDLIDDALAGHAKAKGFEAPPRR